MWAKPAILFYIVLSLTKAHTKCLVAYYSRRINAKSQIFFISNIFYENIKNKNCSKCAVSENSNYSSYIYKLSEILFPAHSLYVILHTYISMDVLVTRDILGALFSKMFHFLKGKFPVRWLRFRKFWCVQTRCFKT